MSAEQQISAALLADSGTTEKPDLEMLKDAASSIYNQYLSEKVSLPLRLGSLCFSYIVQFKLYLF